MRFRLLFIALMLVLGFWMPCHGQSLKKLFSSSMSPNRLLLDSEFGSATGMGFKFPHMAFGFSVERPISHVELQSNFLVSPDVKSFAHSGHDYNFGGKALVWITRRVAVQVGMSYSIYWSAIPNYGPCILDDLYSGGCRYEETSSTPYHKAGKTPFVGVVIRDSWFGSPGRLYLQYYFPTGCEWATASNPCDIQSSRIQGIGAEQEFRLFEHVRVGFKAKWIRYADQSNQYAPQLGRVWHNTSTMTATIRYEMGSAQVRKQY